MTSCTAKSFYGQKCTRTDYSRTCSMHSRTLNLDKHFKPDVIFDFSQYYTSKPTVSKTLNKRFIDNAQHGHYWGLDLNNSVNISPIHAEVDYNGIKAVMLVSTDEYDEKVDPSDLVRRLKCKGYSYKYRPTDIPDLLIFILNR